MKDTKSEAKLRFLTDENAENDTKYGIEAIDVQLERLPQVLTECGQATDEQTQFGAITDGVRFLKEQAVKKFNDWADSHECPHELRAVGLEQTEAGVSSERLQPVDAWFRELRQLFRELGHPVQTLPKDVEFNNNRYNLSESFKTAILDKTKIAITPEIDQMADELIAVSQQMKALDDRGVNLLYFLADVIGNRYNRDADKILTHDDVVRDIVKTIEKTRNNAEADGILADCRAWRISKLTFLNSLRIYKPTMI